MRETIRSFDRHVQDRVNRLPRALHGSMLFFTLIGQPPFTVGIAAAVMGYGWALSLPSYFWAGMLALATVVVVSILKLVLRRPRPRNTYVRNMIIKTFSFPSGHAAGALASYGLVAAIASSLEPVLALPMWLAALSVTFLISLSRVYLKAHYASDIIGGWIVGAAGLALIVIELFAINGSL